MFSPQALLDSKPDGNSKLQDLKQQSQNLCANPGLDDRKRREVEDSVRKTEEQWKKVQQAAQEAQEKTGTEAAANKDYDAFKSQSEKTQAWIREKKQKLMSLGGQMPFEERLQVAQVSLGAFILKSQVCLMYLIDSYFYLPLKATTKSKPEGDSKLLDLKKQADPLCERLEESRKVEVQQLLKDTEQQWKNVLQGAKQAELRALSDDFDSQNKNTQSWIRERQQKLQSVGAHTPAEERSHTAQVTFHSALVLFF